MNPEMGPNVDSLYDSPVSSLKLGDRNQVRVRLFLPSLKVAYFFKVIN